MKLFSSFRRLPPGYELRYGYVAGIKRVYDANGSYITNGFTKMGLRHAAWRSLSSERKPEQVIERGPRP